MDRINTEESSELKFENVKEQSIWVPVEFFLNLRFKSQNGHYMKAHDAG